MNADELEKNRLMALADEQYPDWTSILCRYNEAFARIKFWYFGISHTYGEGVNSCSLGETHLDNVEIFSGNQVRERLNPYS